MFMAAFHAAMQTQDTANTLYRTSIAPLINASVATIETDDFDIDSVLTAARREADLDPHFYDQTRQTIAGMLFVNEQDTIDLAWNMARDALNLMRDGRLALNKTSIDIPKPLRPLDLQDPSEKLLHDLLEGDIQVIWRHDFDFHNSPAHFLLRVTTEDGPAIAGISTWLSNGTRQYQLVMYDLISEVTQPDVSILFESGIRTEGVHENDKLAQAFEAAIPGAQTPLWLHWKDETAAADGMYGTYFGRLKVDDTLHFVAGHAERRGDGEITPRVAFLLPEADLVKALDAVPAAAAPTI